MPRNVEPDAPADKPEPVVEQPPARVNDLPYDALVHVGGGRYEFVPRGAPWPTDTPKEG